MVELLAPAGNWDCARSAVANGADAIYFGLDSFNARMRADNFTLEDLPELVAFLHQRGVRGYVTLNTLIFTAELGAVEEYLRAVIEAGVDGAIVQDIGLARLIRHISPDFPIHASTQMTITSRAGVDFAEKLGCCLVVLARECSIKEIRKIRQHTTLPLEVFVHGALCVAYSGQCLTSEALGGRSANRGECAQACRMPYELVVDGKVWNLGDRQYLLSPQDLAGLPLVGELIASGVSSLKIEGRLKTPEYVAAVTQTYRQAIDRILAEGSYQPTAEDWYKLQMSFSRGLYTGWLRGIDNQKLVHGRYAKKRGVYLGAVEQVKQGRVWLKLQAPLQPGDGVVIVQPDRELGGRVYSLTTARGQTGITIGNLDSHQIKPGDKIWKTSDPQLEQSLHQTYTKPLPLSPQPLHLVVQGKLHQPLQITAHTDGGLSITVSSSQLLQPAHNQPLNYDRLWSQLSRLGNTPFYLASLEVHLEGDLILPISAINQLRRTIVGELTARLDYRRQWQINPTASYRDLLPQGVPPAPPSSPQLLVLVRNPSQLLAALDLDIPLIYCELEDPRQYRSVVETVRQSGKSSQIWVTPPRITKPGEEWILKQLLNSGADGYLIRNYDHLEFFASCPTIGDFSFNVANPLTAHYLMANYPLQRLTCSYDLNGDQLADLVQACPPHWLEVTIHQHIPLFHMEHCVFCAFLSKGKDYRDCGRPCEKHRVKLRDRVGVEHILQADAGCRNTLFNGRAQTGAEHIPKLQRLGVQYFRLEFLQEDPDQLIETVKLYRQVLAGQVTGKELWQRLKLQNQLGVTRGTTDRV